MSDVDLHSSLRGYKKAIPGAVILIKWHEVVQTFAMVDYVRKTTSNLNCQYGQY